MQCPSGDVVPSPQSAGRGGAGDQSSAGCSGAKMAARRGRRDRAAPPPTGGPGPDPGGGVRGGGWASWSQAPHGTVGAVSAAEQVRGWRAARGWQQSGVCRAVTRGRHRKGRKHSRADAAGAGQGGGDLGRFLGVTPAEVGTLRRLLGTPAGRRRASETWPSPGRRGLGLGVEG